MVDFQQKVANVTDPRVQLVTERLRRQPFSLRILTLRLFMVEAVDEEYGEETKKSFENDLRVAFRKLPFPSGTRLNGSRETAFLQMGNLSNSLMAFGGVLTGF